MNPHRLLTLLSLIIYATASLAQPTADSARYNSPSQDIVSVYFSEPVTLSDLTGWSIDVGGTLHTPGPAPAGMALLGITGNRVDIRLLFAFPKTNIEFADVVAGVYVHYDGSGDLRQAVAPNMPVASFSNLLAINDVIITCAMLSSAQQIGTATSSGPCQPVTIQLYLEWNWLPIARNSIHFNPNRVTARVLMRDLYNFNQYYVMSESIPGSGKFTLVTPVFTYPEEDVCTYNPTSYPVMFPKTGDTEQTVVNCFGGVNQQDYVLPAYRLDNEQLDGNLQIDPPLGSDPTLFCVGEDISDFVFEDVTTFNCNVNVEPVRPNQDDRWMKFIYGTHTTAGIPDVWIDVHGTPVFVTDANGDPVTGPFTIDPATGGTIGPYTTSSGFYESEVFHVPNPATAPIASTYPIYHTGNFATDSADDVFGVTLYNWGPCNPWDPNYPATPIEIYDELRLILSPPPPTVPSPDACYGSVPPSITATGTGGEIRWYDAPEPINPNLVYTGGTYTHGETEVGVYNWWLTQTMSTGGPVECTSDTARSTLTVYPLPNKPVINVSGPASFCYDGSTSVTLTADPDEPPEVSGYQWYRNSTPIGGATTNSITLSQVSESGSYTVSTEGMPPTYCPSQLSDPVVITIGEPVTVDAGPATATICSSQTYATTGSYGGGATSATWNSSGDGFFLNPADPTTTYTPGSQDIIDGLVTLRLTTNDPPTACPAEYDELTLTIVRAPSVYAGADASICESETYHITDATASYYNALDWDILSGTGNLSNQGIVNPVYNPGIGDAGSTVILQMTAESLDPACPDVSDQMTITVDAAPSASVGPDQPLCNSTTATLDGNSAGTDLDNNARGEWTYANNLVFHEGFTGDPDGAQDGVNWNLDVSNTIFPTGNHVRVLNNEMMGNYISNNTGYAEFETEDIDISSSGTVKVSVNLRSSTNHESVDFINVYYVLNAGTPTLFSVNGSNTGNIGSRMAQVSGLNGTSLKIIIRLRNSAGNEYYYFDNITVRQDDGITIPVITDPMDPNSEVTGLLQGNNVFNWTVYSEHGACTPAVAPYTITRDLLPDAADAGTDQSFCETDHATMAGNTVTNGGAGTWTLESGTGTITTPGSPTTTVTGLGYGPNVFRWTISSELGICSDSWDEVTITRNPDPLNLSGNVSIAQNPVCYNNAPVFTITGTEADVRYWLYSGGNPVAGPVQGGGTINLTPPAITATTTYTVRAVKDGTGCEIFFGNYTVNVNPQFSQAQLYSSMNICSGDDVTFYATLTGGTGPYNLTYSDGTNTYNINPYDSGDPITALNITSNTTFHIVSVTDALGCPADDLGSPITFTVGVIPTAADLTGGGAICLGTDTSLRVSITGGAPPFTIVFDNPILGTQVTPNNITEFPLNGLAVGSYTFNVLSVTDHCGISVPVGNITGNPQTIVVNAIPDAGTTANNDPVICNNGTTSITLDADIPGTTFTWTVTDDDGAGANAGSGNLGDDIAEILTNGTNAPIDVIYHITPIGPAPTNCPGTTVNRTVTVEPVPQASISNTTTVVCTGGNVNIAITSPTTPTTPADLGFELEVTSTDDTNLGGSASVDLSNQSFPLNITGTLTNNSNVPITVTYEVTPTLDGCASGPPKQTTVIVEPVPVVTVTNNTPEICNSNQVEIIINSPTSSTDEADLSYTVVVTSSNLPATGGTAFADITLLKTDLPHTIDGTLTNSSNAPLTVTFTVTPRLAGCTNGTAVQTTVIVEPTVAVTAVGETICSGTDTDIDVNTLFSGTNGVRYTWTVSDPSGLGATNGPAAVQFSDNIQQTLTNDTHTNPRMVTYTIHGFTIDGLGAEQCAGPSIDVEVWVEPEVEVTASGQTICSEQSTSIDVNTSYSGTNGVLYRWTVNDPDGLGAVAGSGADFSDNIVQSLTNTTTSPKMVTYTITGYTTDGTGTETCQGPSHDVEVWVEPVIEILAAGDTICSGQSTGIDVNTLYSGTLGMRYRWTVDDPDGLGAFDGSDNQFSQNIVQPLTNTTNSPKKVTYNIVGYTVDGTNTETCAGPIHSVDIWVEPEVVVTAAGQTICSGTATNIDVNTVYSGTNGVRYRWSVNDPSGLGGLPGTNYSFGTNITQTLTNTTTSARSITYTITGYTVDDDGNESCPGPPLSIQVWVEPVVVVTANSPTICYGDMAVINVNSTYSTTNGILYTWTVSAPAAITGESNGPPAGQPLSADIEQTLDLVAGTFTPQTATYTITPYATDGGGGFACTGSSLDVDVIVNPKPTANPVNHAPIIPTGSQTDIEMDGDVAGTTFGWRVLNPGTTGATDGSGLDIGDRIQQTLSNTGATPVTVTYRIGPSANGCLGDSVDVTVQIDPDVDMTVVNNAPDICTGSSTDIDISSSVSGATFSWTVDPNSVGATAGSGGPNTHTIQQTLTNTGTSPVSVVYHITPTGPAPTFIEGTTQDITVTVYPEPLALPVNNAPSICNGSSTDIDLDSDVTGTTFTWTVTDPSGASGAAASATPRPIGYTIVQALSNSGNTPVTVTYNITPTGPLPTQCVGDPVQVDVIIEPTPVANITNAAPVICSGEETDITLNASVAGSTFVYSVTDPKGTGATDGTGNAGDHIRQVLVNSTQTPVTITYEIIPYGPGSNACQGTAVYEDVTVNPLPVTSAITGADTVCEQTPDLVFSVVHTNNSFYEWYVPASIGSPTFGGTGLDNYAVVLLAADVAVMTTDSLWVNETNQYGCKGDTIYKPLTVIPYPDPADILGEASVCAYATHTYEIPGNPGSTYQWFVPPGSSIITNPALNTIDVTFGLFSGQIRVIETTAGGCVTSHNPLDVTVNMLPVVTLNADKIAICTGDLVTFTAGPAGALNYEFFLNGATVQNGGSNIYQTMSLVNDDQVTVKVTSLAGCENTSLPVRITVYDLPVVTLTSSDPDNIICYGEPVTFSAASAMAVHYNFFRNGVSEQSGPLDFYTVTDLNDGDEVYVEVLSAFGCPGASDTITTQVNPLPVAEISGDNIICPGDLTDLVVTVTTGAGPFEVTVDNGVGTLSPYNSADPIPVSPLFNTTYTLVSVTDANGCTSAVPSANLTGSASITVRDTVGIITQPRDAEVCEAVDTSFTVGASGDGLAFEWQYTDELSNPFTTITAVTPGYTGYDQATLHVVAPGASLDGYYYRVIVTGTCPEFSVSDTVQIIIKYDPTISRDPFNMAVCEGELAGFGAETGSTADPHFLWQLSTDNGLNWADLGDTAFYSGTKTDSLFIATTQSRFDGYRYRIIVTGECGGTVTSNAATLTIYERPEILDQPDNITVCENDPASFEVNAGVTSGASYLWQVDMNDGFGYRDILADSAGIYSGYNTNELLLLNPESRFDGYRYRVMVSGICSPPIYSQPATITVFEKAEIVTQPDFRIICEGQSTLFTVNAGTTTAPNYEWQVDMDNSGTFMTIGADTAVYSGHANASLILTGVPAAYDGYIYRVIVGGACPETVVSDTAILRVKISPHILIHPENDTVCEGDPATFMVDAGTTTNAAYQWQVNRYGVWEDIDDLSGDYTGTGQPVLTVNNTASANNGYLFRVLVSGDCAPPATSDYAALVIDRLPEISLHPVNREVCEDENTFFFVRPGLTTEPGFLWEYSINGSDWFAAGGLSGVSDDTNDTLHITGIPSAYDGYLFHAVISGKCAPPVTSDPAIVTVFEKPQIDDQPDDAFTCEGIPVSFSVDAGITSNPVYTWEYFNGVNWLTVMGTQFSGQGTATLNVVNPTSSLHSMNFRVVVGGYCDPPVISDTVVLTVYENAEITAHPENTAICEGDNTTFSVNPGVTTNPSFEWQYNDGINNWQIVPDDGVHSGINSGVLSLTGVPFSQDTWQYRVVITGDCGIPVTSNPADLLVYRRPEITQHPVNDTACESGSVAFSIEVGLTDVPFIQWEENDGVSGWQPIAEGGDYVGTNTTELKLFAVDSAMTGYQYHAVLSGFCEPAVISDPATLIVKAAPKIWADPTDVTVCEGNPTEFSVDATATNIGYLWQVNMNDGAGYQYILEDSAGIYLGFDSRVLILLNPMSRFDGYRYRAVVSGDCEPYQYSQPATLTVLEKAEIETQPEFRVICEYENTVFTVSAGATTAPTYEWQVDMDNSGTFVTIGADTAVYSGHANASLILTGVPQAYDGYIYRVIVGGACPETVTSDTAILRVKISPHILIHPENDTVCEGDPATFMVDAGTTADAKYQWQVNRYGVWENIDDLSGDYTNTGQPVLTVNNTVSTSSGYRFRALVSGYCLPPATSDPATLFVDRRPEISLQPVNRDICEDGDLFFVVRAGSTTQPEYLWEYSINGSDWFAAGGLSGVSDDTNDTLFITGISSAYDGYLFHAVITGKCGPPATSDPAVMTVFEKPQIDEQPVSQDACEFDTVSFSVNAGVTTNPNYQWQIFNGATWVTPPPDIYSGTNSSTLTISGVHTGIDGQQIRVIVGGQCAPEIISDTVILTVYERPEIVAQPKDVVICDGDSTWFGIDAGITTAPVITWEYFDGTDWQTATGGFFEDWDTDTIVLNGVSATWSGTGFRAVVGNLCGPNDTSIAANLLVHNRPQIVTQPVETNTCEGIPASFFVNAGVTTNPVFTWQIHNGTDWTNVTGSQYSGQGTGTLTVLNPTSAHDSVAFRVIVSGYCEPTVISDSVLLTVDENAEIALHPLSVELCEGSDTVFTVDPGATTNPSFEWFYNDGVNGWQTLPADAVHSGIHTSTLVLTNIPYSQDNWQYRAVVTGICGIPATSNPADLIVYRRPEIVLQPVNAVVCELKNASFIIDPGETDIPFIRWEVNDGVSGWVPISDGGNYIGSTTPELKLFTVDSAMNGYQYHAIVSGVCEPEVVSDPATLFVKSAPEIWQHPSDVTVCEGDNAGFSIMATGDNLHFTWQADDGSGSGFADIVNDNGGLYAGWDTPTLSLTGIDRSCDMYKYRVRVEGDCTPMKISDLAVLFVQTPPEIQLQPGNDTICEYSNASFTVTATGMGLSYQWYESTNNGASWMPLSDIGMYIGTATPSLNIFSVGRSYDGNLYHVEISGTCGDPVTSVDVILDVKTAPEILIYPENTTVCVGNPATFELEAEGSELVYRWQVNDGVSGFTDINPANPAYSGADSESLTLLSAALSQNGYSYRAIVSGTCTPPATTPPVILLVNSNPEITSQPVNRSICENGTTNFSASATGPDLVYQWYVDRNDGNGFVLLTDDENHNGADTDNLLISNAPESMDGNHYRLDVSSACLPVSTDVVTLTVWDNPVPDIQGDLPNFPLICGGDLLTLDANPSGGSGTYTSHHWSGDISPLNSVSESVVRFRTLISGTYDLVYTVTDDNGCKGSQTVSIINDRPNAQFLSDAIPSCGYLDVNFTNTSSADAVSFLWDFDDGSYSTQANPNHGFDNFDPSGMVRYYNVKLIASSENGCKDTAQSVVTIYPKVSAEIIADTTIGCHPFNVEMSSQPGAASYFWDYGDGNGEQGSYVTYHLFENYSDSITTYTTTLTTESFYGCVAEATIDITVHPIPKPNFEAVPLVQTYPDATVTFTNITQPGPWAYLWDFGDGTTSTLENPVHTYDTHGTYQVILYVSTDLCIDSVGTTVVINPRAPEAAFTAPLEGCSPLEVQFTNQSLYATTYLWDFGDGYVSTKEHPQHTYYEFGEYTVRLQVNGPGGTDYASWVITVWETPNVAFNWAPDSVFVKDKPVRFFNLTSGATNYLWDFGDYDEETGAMLNAETNFSTEEDPQHIYLTEGWKDVKLVAWNDRCIDSLLIPQAVKVIPAGDIVFPTVFRPNPGGPSGGYVDPTDPNLDPNVANSIFYPGINRQVAEYHLYIYNRWGNLIFQSDDITIGWDGYIEGNQASQGVYIWKVTGVYSNGKPFSKAGDVTLLWKRPQ